MFKRVTALIIKEEKWYVAHCLELGIVSQGMTIEEAKANLREAVELFHESLEKDLLPEGTGEASEAFSGLVRWWIEALPLGQREAPRLYRKIVRCAKAIPKHKREAALFHEMIASWVKALPENEREANLFNEMTTRWVEALPERGGEVVLDPLEVSIGGLATSSVG